MQHKVTIPAMENSATNEMDEENEETFAPMRGRYFDSTDESLFRNAIVSSLPIELEIGSGKGLFLTHAATQNPSHQFIGLELATRYAKDCQSKIVRLGLPNACFIASDAVAVIDQDVADETLTAVHVYFPDPWWKSKHKKRRVLSEQTIRNIERTLKVGGELHFWTDVLDYYEQTLEMIDAITKLDGPFFVSEPKCDHDMDYRTHFERRTRRNGLPVYRSRYVKRAP